MKCPFCQQELVRYWGMTKPALYCCDNQKCSRGGIATESAWQELIRTRKALDVAVDVVKEIDELLCSNRFDIKEAPLLNIVQTKTSMLLKYINIEQITALKNHFANASKKVEQKGSK